MGLSDYMLCPWQDHRGERRLEGFHDERLIKSALARPNQSAFGEEMYVDVFAKAAALLDSIANNHGFRDGNKRTAMAAAVLYLHNNDIEIRFTNEEYEVIMLHVVNDKPAVDEIKTWLVDHSADSEQQEG